MLKEKQQVWFPLKQAYPLPEILGSWQQIPLTPSASLLSLSLPPPILMLSPLLFLHQLSYAKSRLQERERERHTPQPVN